jgi:hypothetical protein
MSYADRKYSSFQSEFTLERQPYFKLFDHLNLIFILEILLGLRILVNRLFFSGVDDHL